MDGSPPARQLRRDGRLLLAEEWSAGERVGHRRTSGQRLSKAGRHLRAALPLAGNSCDGAYATESLEHAVDIPRAISEMCRIVKPGGRIAIIDKNASAWWRLETPAWEKWFGRRELEKLLAQHCSLVESRPISYWEDVEPDRLFLAWLAVK